MLAYEGKPKIDIEVYAILDSLGYTNKEPDAIRQLLIEIGISPGNQILNLNGEVSMKFNIEGNEYEVGTRMFPVADIDDVRIYDLSNTEPFSNEELSRIIDINEFEIGHCYTNAEKIRLICEKLEIPVEYFSGWLFVPNQENPLHHAWAVIDKKHLIDMGFSERDIKFQKKIQGDPRWRERFAEETARRRATIRRSKDCVMGKVPEGMKYVGSPDEINSAKKIFRDLIKRYPKHISYRKKGMNPTGASPIQEMVWRMEGKSF